jgi:hypothetical protein
MYTRIAATLALGLAVIALTAALWGNWHDDAPAYATPAFCASLTERIERGDIPAGTDLLATFNLRKLACASD